MHPFKKSESRASVLHTTSESAPPATESQNSDLGFLNSITSKKTHPNSASCVPSPSFPWGSQLLRLKLYMAFAPSHVQFDFDSPRSRWSGGGSATARRWSFSRLNRPHDRRFRVLGLRPSPASLRQGPPALNAVVGFGFVSVSTTRATCRVASRTLRRRRLGEAGEFGVVACSSLCALSDGAGGGAASGRRTERRAPPGPPENQQSAPADDRPPRADKVRPSILSCAPSFQTFLIALTTVLLSSTIARAGFARGASLPAEVGRLVHRRYDLGCAKPKTMGDGGESLGRCQKKGKLFASCPFSSSSGLTLVSFRHV